MAIEVVRVGPGSGLERAQGIRRAVFVEELGVTVDEEFDDRDDAPQTVHVIAVVDGLDVGTARLVADRQRRGVVHITRVAVLARARGSGVGRAMMAALEDVACADFAIGAPPRVRLELSVMEPAAEFYRSIGYDVGSDRHLEVRIWHRRAFKELEDGSSGGEPRRPVI